jgi:hypothetical protein
MPIGCERRKDSGAFDPKRLQREASLPPPIPCCVLRLVRAFH